MHNDNKFLKAYPNHQDYLEFAPPRDTRKWMQAVREVYYRAHKGMDKNEALNQVVSGWSNMEKLDFKNWLKFYEENAHKKYKTAQQINYWEDANRAGYFVPIFPDKPKQEEVMRASDVDLVKNPETHPDIHAEEKRQVIEKQRSKIIGRLDSAEKLLRSQEGQLFAGKELETLLDVIYSLKKKIQMVNKISVSTRLYEDMIIREANILSKNGYRQAGATLHKLAQAPLSAEPPANPTVDAGRPGHVPEDGPGLNPPPGPAPTPEPEMSQGMSKFLEGLDTNNDTITDQQEEEIDQLEVSDADDDFISTAQMLPRPDIEVAEEKNDIVEDSFGQKMDRVLDTVSIHDVISEFEFISNFYKAREIPRRLSKADMMLDSLGLASFFPSLAEAQNKALESNNYISTRVEEILSKLRGSIKTQNVELTVEPDKIPNEGIAAVKKNLQDEENKEKARKQMRKDLETQSLMAEEKPTPELEVAEDLATPAQIQPPPAPARPPVPPIR